MIICPKCNSDKIQKDGNHNGMQRYKCLTCKKRFDYGAYEGSNKYINHFSVKIKKTERNKLTRDNYCVPTNELDYKDKKNLRIADEFYKKIKDILYCVHLGFVIFQMKYIKTLIIILMNM